ncbi:putative scytalone dehydratase [Lasiosphaeria miniovina]|uniref:Scytalone dehydratase n=1 Tax=Lasiosphaeria miniovina TaxID=1954250 RepID=A0AA40BJ04_9PEZI|nr:putative scytalone dehydratase [Lasiosphaeria miniovina]KAK0735114.1 putative scytalone dehydratase [Lasiosphaeria miniovina]
MAEPAESPPTFQDVLGCQAAIFEWAESYDTKDWDRLAKCIAPTLFIDYTTVMDKVWEDMPAPEFLAMASSEHFLGNKRIKTQHLIGAGRWVQTGADTITGYHQMRVAHQKYKDDGLTEVLYKGHAHGKATVRYRRVAGVWKFAGLTPDIRWAEHDYDKIFTED